MKVIRLKNSDLLSKDELSVVKNLGVEKCWYIYHQGAYDGSGSILMCKGNKYCLDSLSHCSCHGPVDDLTFDGVCWQDMKKKHSEGLMEDAKQLIELADKER